MFRHVVLFNWTDGMTEEMEAQFAAELTALAPTLPGVRAYQAGPDAGLVEGNFDFAVVADFDDAEPVTSPTATTRRTRTSSPGSAGRTPRSGPRCSTRSELGVSDHLAERHVRCREDQGTGRRTGGRPPRLPAMVGWVTWKGRTGRRRCRQNAGDVEDLRGHTDAPPNRSVRRRESVTALHQQGHAVVRHDVRTAHPAHQLQLPCTARK